MQILGGMVSGCMLEGGEGDVQDAEAEYEAELYFLSRGHF